MTAKSLYSQNVWEGAGALDESVQVKISYLKMIKIVLTLIYSVILLSGQP